MKKLKLNLEDLRVESFELNSGKEVKKGTIHGNEEATVGGDTCDESCVFGTCYVSCDVTCDQFTCHNTECGQNTCDTCYETCAGYGKTCIYPQCL
ncbi:MAG: hypothetical protein PVH88_04120 [Ignavibacteria bacterium]|jgi:hypothetical protein